MELAAPKEKKVRSCPLKVPSFRKDELKTPLQKAKVGHPPSKRNPHRYKPPVEALGQEGAASEDKKKQFLRG